MSDQCAVQFYADRPESPEMLLGIPPQWTAEVIEAIDPAACPPGWTVMTKAELAAYQAEHQAAVDAWRASLESV